MKKKKWWQWWDWFCLNRKRLELFDLADSKWSDRRWCEDVALPWTLLSDRVPSDGNEARIECVGQTDMLFPCCSPMSTPRAGINYGYRIGMKRPCSSAGLNTRLISFCNWQWTKDSILEMPSWNILMPSRWNHVRSKDKKQPLLWNAWNSDGFCTGQGQ